jgi:hypothetical protein
VAGSAPAQPHHVVGKSAARSIMIGWPAALGESSARSILIGWLVALAVPSSCLAGARVCLRRTRIRPVTMTHEFSLLWCRLTTVTRRGGLRATRDKLQPPALQCSFSHVLCFGGKFLLPSLAPPSSLFATSLLRDALGWIPRSFSRFPGCCLCSSLACLPVIRDFADFLFLFEVSWLLHALQVGFLASFP